MGFSQKIKEDIMVACGRHCCLCHKFCGLKIEIHHIKPQSEGGSDTLENAIPLCFDCHADMRSYDAKHPKGTKYTEKELTQRRDSLYQNIKNNDNIQSRHPENERDKKIYEYFLKTLPWKESVSVLLDHNFQYPFKKSLDKNLLNFIDLSKNPSFRFSDINLENAKNELLDAIKKYLNLITYNSFSINLNEYQVQPDWENMDDKNKLVYEIHDAINKIDINHKNLTEIGTNKFSIVPDM